MYRPIVLDQHTKENTYALYFIVTTGDWFDLSKFLSGAVYIFVAYLMLSVFLSIWFSFRKEKLQLAN